MAAGPTAAMARGFTTQSSGGSAWAAWIQRTPVPEMFRENGWLLKSTMVEKTRESIPGTVGTLYRIHSEMDPHVVHLLGAGILCNL